jgi:hypothetical protein
MIFRSPLRGLGPQRLKPLSKGQPYRSAKALRHPKANFLGAEAARHSKQAILSITSFSTKSKAGRDSDEDSTTFHFHHRSGKHPFLSSCGISIHHH